MFRITLIACGNKMPAWVNEGSMEFTKRLKEHVQLTIVEIPLQRRNKSSDLARILEKEAGLMLAAVPATAHVIALEIKGKSFDSEQLAATLEHLQQKTAHLCFVIGGPEGLSPQVLARCQAQWSLSSLTLPHPMVRLVLLEALYRAYCIINHHPYHK